MSDERRDGAADRWQPPERWSPPPRREDATDKDEQAAVPAAPGATESPATSVTPPDAEAPRRDTWQAAPDPWRTTPPVSTPPPASTPPPPSIPPLPWERKEPDETPVTPVRAPDVTPEPPARNVFDAPPVTPMRQTPPGPPPGVATVSATSAPATSAPSVPTPLAPSYPDLSAPRPAAPSLPSVPPVGAPSRRDEPTRAWRASELTETAQLPLRPTPPVEEDRRAVGEVRRLRRGRLAIRKIDPISVFRFSIVFQFCGMLIGLLAFGLIYLVLRAIGTIGTLEQLIGETITSEFSINGGKIVFYGFIIGCIWTVASSVVMTFGSFLYNLIADVVGGVELIVVERDDR